MKFIPLLSVCSLAAIVACTQTSNNYTDSGFRTPSSGGIIFTSLSQTSRGSEIDASGDGFAYVVGKTDGDGFRGYSGIVPTTSVAPPPTSGTATMSGRYEIALIENIKLSGSFLSGNKDQAVGNITLNANFGTGKLQGASGDLRVNGQFQDSNLSGGVTFRGVSGDLVGQIGPDEAIGAFHGNDGELIYAGGFLVDK